MTIKALSATLTAATLVVSTTASAQDDRAIYDEALDCLVVVSVLSGAFTDNADNGGDFGYDSDTMLAASQVYHSVVTLHAERAVGLTQDQVVDDFVTRSEFVWGEAGFAPGDPVSASDARFTATIAPRLETCVERAMSTIQSLDAN